jgi:hypothetical protein
MDPLAKGQGATGEICEQPLPANVRLTGSATQLRFLGFLCNKRHLFASGAIQRNIMR